MQTAKSICIESKKKNITRSDIEAPRGKQRACIVSKVANLSAIGEIRYFSKIGKVIAYNQQINCYLFPVALVLQSRDYSYSHSDASSPASLGLLAPC